LLLLCRLLRYGPLLPGRLLSGYLLFVLVLLRLGLRQPRVRAARRHLLGSVRPMMELQGSNRDRAA